MCANPFVGALYKSKIMSHVKAMSIHDPSPRNYCLMHFQEILYGRYWDMHTNLWNCEFPENLQWKQKLLTCVNELVSVLSTLMWVKCSTRNLNITVLCVCEFHKNQHRDGHAFLMGVYKITFTFMPSSFSASPPHPHHSIYIPKMADAWQQFICNVTNVR